MVSRYETQIAAQDVNLRHEKGFRQN